MLASIRAFICRLVYFTRRHKSEGFIDSELKFHLDMEIKENLRQGMSPEEARRRALLALGGIDQTKEAYHEAGVIGWLEALVRNVRYAVRWLIKRPVFTVVVVLSLAIGIGVNTLIFSSFNEFYLRPFSAAVKDQNSLAWMFTNHKKAQDLRKFSYPEYLDYMENNSVFSDILASGDLLSGSLRVDNKVDMVSYIPVSYNYFSMLGIQVKLGRSFQPGDSQDTQGQSAAVVSYLLWKTYFNSDPSIVGKEIILDRKPYKVIGVLPDRFDGIDPGSRIHVYISLENWAEQNTALSRWTLEEGQELDPKVASLIKKLQRGTISNDRKYRAIELIGRLKPGVSINQANAAMKTRAQQLQIAYPDTNQDVDFLAVAAKEGHPKRRDRITSKILGMLIIKMLLVLIIPCINVATLLLTRAMERQHEIVIRAALGASRRRVMWQLLTEALLLSLLGGAFGLILAFSLSHIPASVWIPSSIPITVGLELNGTVIGFTVGLCFLISILFSLMPLLHIKKFDLTAALRAQAYQTLRRFWRFGISGLLVVGEIAIAFMIMVMAVLMMQNVENTRSMGFGFEADRLLIVDFDFMPYDYSRSRAQQFKSGLMSRIRSLPGVYSASLALGSPFGNVTTGASIAAVGNLPISGEFVEANRVRRDYFKTLNISFIRGGEFTRYENDFRNIDAIINEAMAQRYWPGQDAMGQQIQLGLDKASRRTVTVVGIVENSILGGVDSSNDPFFYTPMSINENSRTALLIRSNIESRELLQSIKQIIRMLDPEMMVGIQTLQNRIDISATKALVGSTLVVILGILVLAMASIGLYSVISYSVNRRIGEVGIRMALGAGPATVLRQLISDGFRLIAIGIVIGLIAAWLIARGVQSSLVGVDISNPIAYLCAGLLLSIIALIACYLPAKKVLKSEPMTMLRCE